MNNTDKNDMLFCKMLNEQKSFRKFLLTLPPEEILAHAGEYTIREEIVHYFTDRELGESDCAALSSLQYPVEDVFRQWMKQDDSIEEDIERAVNDCIKSFGRQQEQTAKQKPQRDER